MSAADADLYTGRPGNCDGCGPPPEPQLHELMAGFQQHSHRHSAIQVTLQDPSVDPVQSIIITTHETSLLTVLAAL